MSQSTINGKPRLRIAVIGGGLSGLSACYFLKQKLAQQSTPVDITLFEASDRCGGVFGTIQQDGYRIETGADMFITNKPAALELSLQLGLESRMIETVSRYRRSLILRHGKPVPTPAGFDLMVPRNLGPFLKSPLLSAAGKLRVLGEYFLPSKPQADETLSSFVKRRFGREAFDRIIQPMIGGIYTADPDKLSLRATLPRFLDMEAEHGSLIKAALRERKAKQANGQRSEQASGARYGLFVSFDDGMSVLQDQLVAAISPECTIHTNTPITGITLTQAGPYHLTSDRELESDQFDAILLTLPAPRAAQLLNSAHADVASQLQLIPYASAAIVVTGHRLADIAHNMEAFGLVIPAVEQRKILAVSFASRKFPDRAPDGSILLRTFIGGALQQQLLKQSDEQLLDITRAELADIFGISRPPELTHVVRWNQAMPQYHLGHLERVESIERAVSEWPGLELAGNAFRGVGLPDVISSAHAAVERLCDKLSGMTAKYVASGSNS